MGEGLEALLGIRDTNSRQQLHGLAVGGLAGEPAVGSQRLGQLVADRQHRIERSHGVLEDHGHRIAAHVLQGAW